MSLAYNNPFIARVAFDIKYHLSLLLVIQLSRSTRWGMWVPMATDSSFVDTVMDGGFGDNSRLAMLLQFSLSMCMWRMRPPMLGEGLAIFGCSMHEE